MSSLCQLNVFIRSRRLRLVFVTDKRRALTCHTILSKLKTMSHNFFELTSSIWWYLGDVWINKEYCQLLLTRTPAIVKGNKSLNLVWFKWGSQWWEILKHFPQSRCILISLVERKVAEFYHNIDRRHWLVWSKWLIFITFSGQLMVSLCRTEHY